MLLDEVKKRLSITGDYNDPTILGLIEDVKAYAMGAGVSAETLDSEMAYGLISRGVADLWNLNGGGGVFSEVFKLRLIQLQAEAKHD